MITGIWLFIYDYQEWLSFCFWISACTCRVVNIQHRSSITDITHPFFHPIKSPARSPPRHQCLYSRVENPRINNLMPPQPQIHPRNPLPRVLHLNPPPNPQPSLHLLLQPPPTQNPLRSIGPHYPLPHPCAHNRFRVVEQECISGFML